MKAIVDYTEEEYEKMRNKQLLLFIAISGIDRRELYTYTRSHGYASYGFNGAYTDKLVKALGRHPDSDEIIMLVDGGFSHFGASCYVNTRDKSFSGRVCVD